MSVRPSRRRLAPAAILAGVAGTAALALTMTGTMSAFTASITNSANAATVGTLTMQEADSTGKVLCNSTDDTTGHNAFTSCSTINKYGTGLLSPGSTNTTTVTMKNTGTIAASAFSLTPAACSQTPKGGSGTTNAAGVTAASDLCSKLQLVLTSGSGRTVYSGTLDGFNSAGAQTLTPLQPGQSQTYTFAVTLPNPNDGSIGNAYQGLTANQQMTWAFSS